MEYKKLFYLFWWQFQNIIKRLKYKWEKYKWWTPCMIITLTAVLILYYIPPNECIDNVRCILSAISQILAAILALVFAIAMVAAQMTRRYTAMDQIILKLETKLLMIFFGIGIITPLLVLEFGFWKWGVPFSIVIASFCVFSLLPFLINVNRTIKYDIGIVNLNEEIMEAIESGYEPKAKNKIKELCEIGKDAVGELREDDVKEISKQLSKFGKESIENRFGYTTVLIAVDGLKDLEIESIDKGFDDMMTVGIAVDGLGAIGVEAAKNRPDDWSMIVQKVIDSMESVGVKAVEKGFGYTTIHAVRGLKDVIVELRYDTRLSDEKSEYVTANAVQGIWCLGGFVMKYMPKRADTVIQNLKEIEKEIGKELLMKWEKNCVNKYPDLKSSFEKLKRGYNGG
jgi:hypothetical protein